MIKARESMFGKTRRPHLVGIGGAGMSGIAAALAAQGHRVTGSDLADSEAVRALREAGVAVAVGNAAENVPEDADLLIVSAAVRDGNPELEEARRRGLPVLKYAEALGWLVVVGGGHAWGRMYCPGEDRNCRGGRHCVTSVASTPKNSTDHAKLIRRMVSNCIHSRSAER